LPSLWNCWLSLKRLGDIYATLAARKKWLVKGLASQPTQREHLAQSNVETL